MSRMAYWPWAAITWLALGLGALSFTFKWIDAGILLTCVCLYAAGRTHQNCDLLAARIKDAP